MLKQGKGYEAVLLTAYGSLAAIFLLLVISIPSIFLIPHIYNFIKIGIPYLLIIASLILILFEKKKFTALFVLILTGILGEIILKIPSLNQPLLPLLSGLFGSSMLITSIRSKPKIPKQIITIPKVKFIRPLVGALIASPLCSFLPGLGSGQAAVLGSKISSLKKMKRKQFLVLLGATNTLVMGFSFISLYLISKTRTGAAAALQQILGNFSMNLLILLFIIILISGFISFYLTKFLAKTFSKIIEEINYLYISVSTLIVLSIVVVLISGILGFMVFAVSTLTGLYCISLKVRRTNMMGCLLIPTIILYLFNF
jgi:putative membrane protein